MKKSIYFHIDEYNRDTIVASGLYKKLSKHFKFFFGNRIDEYRLKNFDDFVFSFNLSKRIHLPRYS